MSQKDSSRATNPPYLGDYHRMRLYPRHWDMSSIDKASGAQNSSQEIEIQANTMSVEDDPFGANLSPKAFEEWQIGRHYPSDDTYRCDTFSAF